MQNLEKLVKIQDNYYYDNSICLGKGNFGKVYKGYSIKHNKTIAVKVIENHSIKQLQEISNLVRLNNQSSKHKSIMGYYSSVIKSKNLYLMLQICQKGSVEDLIKKFGKVGELQTFKILIQSLEGLQFMHLKTLVHRDIKPGNILLDDDMNAKLGDFGLTKKVSLKMTIGAGTPIYSAPETRTQEIYNEKCDIWSLAVTIYQMLTGYKFFDPKVVMNQDGLIEWQKKWKNGLMKVKYPENIDENWEKIIKFMLVYDFNLRPTAGQVLKFLQKIQINMNKNIEQRYEINQDQKKEEQSMLVLSRQISPHVEGGLVGKRISEFERQQISFVGIEKTRQFLIFSKLKGIIPSLLAQELAKNSQYQLEEGYKYLLKFFSMMITYVRLEKHNKDLQKNEFDTPFGRFSLSNLTQHHLKNAKQILKILKKQYESALLTLKSLIRHSINKLQKIMQQDKGKILFDNLYQKVPYVKDLLLNGFQHKYQEDDIKYIEAYRKICSIPEIHILDEILPQKSEIDLQTYSFIRLVPNIDVIFPQKWYEFPQLVRYKKHQINSLTGLKRIQFIKSINSTQ